MKKILFTLFLLLCCMTAAWAQPWPPAVYEVGTLERLKEVISHRMADGKCIADIKLTADIYMSDLGEGESGRHTLCSTFSGTLDGDGHTIWAARPEVTHNSTGHYHRQYLFTYCDGATIKNLTFKNFRIDSRDHHNQAVITSQAKNGCVFENITFDKISTYVGDGHDNTGAVAGYATTDCVFRNITVKNSDFTADNCQSGAVVGHAMNCTFENIKVEYCESTARNAYSGGVVGRSDLCIFNNVEILGKIIQSNGIYAGGVAGYSTWSHYTNCTIDDCTAVVAIGDKPTGEPIRTSSYAGGIVGYSDHDEFLQCINSGVTAGYKWCVGGIVGYAENTEIKDCLNTGIVMNPVINNMENFMTNNYKQLPIVKRTYNGKTYDVRTNVDRSNYEATLSLTNGFGGIVGRMGETSISRCASIGFMACSAPSLEAFSAIAGIAGDASKASTISYCLSAPLIADWNTGIFGILGVATSSGTTTIENCLSITATNPIYYSNNTVVSENNYSICESDKMSGVEVIDESSVPTGKLVAKLGAFWEQNLGTDPYPMPTGSRELYHTRKVSSQYGTVCLPFAVKSDEKIGFYTFSKEEEDAQGINLMFSYEEDVIPAGTPVLYRAAEAANASELVEICFNSVGEDFTAEPVVISDDTWNMRGTFTEKVFDETTSPSSKNIYYVSGGEIRNAKKVTIAPYRAWIYGESIDDLIGNGASQAKSIRFVIEDEDGSTAALEFIGNDLKPEQKNSKTFSLMGTQVSDSYRGIVIKNGKKMIQNR